jgi:hypothetical protein
MLIIVKWLVFYGTLPMGFVMNFTEVDCITRNNPNCDEHLDDISYFNDDDTINIYNFLKLTCYLILWLRIFFGPLNTWKIWKIDEDNEYLHLSFTDIKLNEVLIIKIDSH